MAESDERFLESIERFKEDFKSVEVRMVAFRWQSSWMNLCTRAILSTRDSGPMRPPATPPKLPDLTVELARMDFNYLYKLLRVFEEGSLSWKGREIVFRRVEGLKFGNEYSRSFRTYSRHMSRQSLGIDARSLVLSGAEAGIQAALGYEGLAMLKSRIASLPQPYDGIGDLVQTFTGYPDLERTSYYSSLEIVAPIWVRLTSECVIKSRYLVIEALLRQGHDPSRTSLGVIEKEGKAVIRRVRKAFGPARTKHEGELRLTAEVPLSPRADSATVLLSYRDDLVDQMDLYRNRISSRNPKMSVMSAIDSELVAYSAGIAGSQKKPGGGLEQAFLTLLTFLGFSCVHIGGDERNPDVLAWALDPETAFVIECTTGEPDLRNKATKFASRLRHIASVSQTPDVVGLLVTTLTHEVINPADSERLKSDNVILVDAGGISRLDELARRGGSLGEALEVLEAFAAQQNLPYRRFTPRTD